MQDFFMSSFMTTQSIRISIVISTTIGLFFVFIPMQKKILNVFFTVSLLRKLKIQMLDEFKLSMPDNTNQILYF